MNPDIDTPQPASALQVTKLLGVTQEECQSKLNLYSINEKAHICTTGNNTGVCKGDSGGNKIFMILVINYHLSPNNKKINLNNKLSEYHKFLFRTVFFFF